MKKLFFERIVVLTAVLAFFTLTANKSAHGQNSLDNQVKPFGLTVGYAVEDFEALGVEFSQSEDNEYLYFTPEPPRTHPDFEMWALLIHPSTGLCELRVAGKDIETTPHGTSMTSAFLGMVTSLRDSYGEQQNNISLESGSIWDEPEDWTMGVLRGERVVQAVWKEEYGSNLPSNIEEIILQVRMQSRHNGFFLLQYRFENYEECTNSIEEEKRSVL